jgi:outer membrane lipoprotein
MIRPGYLRTYRHAAATYLRQGTLLLATSAASFLLAAGCAKPFPPDLLAKVEKNVTYQAFQDQPEQYDGKMLMFGGEIVETKNVENGAWIIVLQRPLDADGRPSWTTESGGRFLVLTKTFLDVDAFHPGRSLTVIGEVNGSQAMPLRGTEYWYPLLVAQQLYLW